MSSNTDNTEDMFRIMSLDGGGIYGLFTVYMLKQLCQGNPNFLKKGCVNLFAGTSAGALHALFLAKYDDPRDAVLGGEIESFWADPLVFSNLNPLNLMASYFGLGPYCGTQEYLSVLRKYFGNLTLGDLKQHVLLTCFDWAGNPHDGKERKWKPKLFVNFHNNDPDWNESVADVAFSVTSPTYLRAIWNGKQDGGLFAPNPTMCAITKVVSEVFSPNPKHEKNQEPGLKNAFKNVVQKHDEDKLTNRDSVLDILSVLSLGVGNEYPFLPVGTMEWGLVHWMSGMWNPTLQQWITPTSYYMCDPFMQDVDLQASQLLNRGCVVNRDSSDKMHLGYHRLAPQVLRMPLSKANLLMRNNPFFSSYIRNEIYKAAFHNSKSLDELKTAADWLEKEDWFS
ncbi:MAG: hypothetical protein GY749_34970 [Desulfobacteraceae bacterium]|nr:hypothetical protein [Desulfobacteraceae bacterium]